MSIPLSHAERKALGAYYTHQSVVRFLVAWGLAAGGRSLMDPSCGDGRFLAEASRLAGLRLVGCDISAEAIAATRDRLSPKTRAELVERDFFRVEPGTVAPVDLVVGNPPFIRYQRFDDQSRRAALASALRLGVRLSRLTSTWAPFLLHAARFLTPGGRIAMVVPAEITRTHYGLLTLEALLQRFARVHLIAFEENFFEDAQAETCLLLAEDWGGSCRSVLLTPLRSIGDLDRMEAARSTDPLGVEVELYGDGLSRFASAYLEPEQRRAWAAVHGHARTTTVAALSQVTNGYVTGDNDFFHRTRESAEREAYPLRWLVPTARSSRSLRGLRFTREDVERHESEGSAHHLLVPQEDLFTEREPLNRLIAQGTRRGTVNTFKCRRRSPWWRVPGLQGADILVGYMAGATPRASINVVRAVYSNSLHGLRLRPGTNADLLALAFYSSLTLLSLEVEGRSYGGGILKIEPRELDRVLVPWPELPEKVVATLADTVDLLLRENRFREASEAVDEVLLRKGLGFSRRRTDALRAGRERLVKRRHERNRKQPGTPQPTPERCR